MGQQCGEEAPEKIDKYIPLAKEIRKLYRVSTKIVPIVLGTLGTIPKGLESNIKKLEIPDIIGSLQMSAMMGTHNILRKVLNSDVKRRAKN